MENSKKSVNVNNRPRNYSGGSGRFHNDRYQRDGYFGNSNHNGRNYGGEAEFNGPSSEDRPRRNYRQKEDNRNNRELDDQRSSRSESSSAQGRQNNGEEGVSGGNRGHYDRYKENRNRGESFNAQGRRPQNSEEGVGRAERYYDSFKDRKNHGNMDRQYGESKFERSRERREVAKEGREESTNWRLKSSTDDKPSGAKRKYNKKDNGKRFSWL